VTDSQRYEKGREAARNVAAMLGDPNWTIIRAQHPAFVSGFTYEWTQYVLPARAFQNA
jgi:hypothetical protein